MAAIKEPGQLDDDGKVDGYPVEGLCLAVLDDGRARPAWLCRKEDNRQSSRLRVLIYGDPAGKARLLTSSERVDALPSTDEALAARLQGDWKTRPHKNAMSYYEAATRWKLDERPRPSSWTW